MKIWILRPKKEQLKQGGLWEFVYGKCHGFVVREETEEKARYWADKNAFSENDEIDGVRPWLDPKYTICIELTTEGRSGIIMRDNID